MGRKIRTGGGHEPFDESLDKFCEDSPYFFNRPFYVLQEKSPTNIMK